MGRIRKFTQEAYDALQSGVSDDGEILDFFSDIPLNISNFFNSLELEDDLSNFQSYLRDISDFENYTAKKIDDIFRDVINVDETYATIFRDFNDRMTDFDTIINKLKESISDVNFENNFSKDGFINSLPKETENIIGVNWKNILDKDADDISDEEYNMIAEYIIKNGDADILEEIGLQRAGAPGTTAALALLNDQVKKGGVMASTAVGGLSGAFIPVSEDQGMIDAVQAGAITLEKLEAMTCVCSVGLDMIAIPGDTKATTISGMIADEMALGMVNQKTTAARLIPVIGKGVGDTVEFGGLFGYAPIMPVNQFSCDAFINRGGRIPAPIHSFKN